MPINPIILMHQPVRTPTDPSPASPLEQAVFGILMVSILIAAFVWLIYKVKCLEKDFYGDD